MDATANWRVNDYKSEGTFYTDSNGLGIVKRDFKMMKDADQMKFDSTAPQNYYPVNTAIYIDNEDTEQPSQMLVMNDRSQGGSGFRKGHIELMFNRRGTSDDALGMGEPSIEMDN